VTSHGRRQKASKSPLLHIDLTIRWKYKGEEENNMGMTRKRWSDDVTAVGWRHGLVVE
jgi:hypothetical protein